MDGRLDIAPGAAVITADGVQVGRVEAVVVDPASGEATGLYLRAGIALAHDVAVPVEAVEESDVTAERVRLRLSSRDLQALPEPEPEPAAAVAPGWPVRADGPVTAASGQAPAAAGGRPLRAGQHVFAGDTEVGRLDLVLLDPLTRRVTDLVVRHGALLVRDTIVPIDLAVEIDRDRIVLGISRDELRRLPEYRPDEEITRDVLDLLWYGDEELGPADVQYVEVRTRAGVVELDGHTSTEAAKRRIEEVARRVRGVIGVRNYLDTVEALQSAIQESRRRAARVS